MIFRLFSRRAISRKVHDTFSLFLGYIGNAGYDIDEFGATFFCNEYLRWLEKSKRFKKAHPFSSGRVFSRLVNKCENDFHLLFCLSAIEYYAPYGDAIGDFLGFYADRCGIRSEFGSYCARFYNEWIKFWKDNGAEFGKVKILVGRDLWESGFVFDDISGQIKKTAEKILKEYSAIEKTIG